MVNNLVILLLICILIACVIGLLFLSRRERKQRSEEKPHLPLLDFTIEYIALNFSAMKAYKDLMQASYDAKYYSQPQGKDRLQSDFKFSRFRNDRTEFWNS